MGTRIGVFGWGIVAPKSPNIAAFANNLDSSESWLSPFNGFGPDNFLVGTPEFNFETYQGWIDSHFAPRQFKKIREKMDLPTLYAIGAFIQSLEQNEPVAQELQALGDKAHVYVGTGLGNIGTIHDASLQLYRRQRAWNRFWASPERNGELKAFLAGDEEAKRNYADAPSRCEETADRETREEWEERWCAYWTEKSRELQNYLVELAAIEGTAIEGDIESGKLNAIRERDKGRQRLQAQWGTPEPPWNVSSDLIFNIHNTPAAQISILGKINGLAFAPVAACSTFGVALRFGMRAIQSGEAKMVVVGATDAPPHPLTVGSFYNARVLSADRNVSLPLTRLKGTHVAGGAIVWIIGDLDYYTAQGYRPLGMEPVAVGVSSDAHHIITPSFEGPRAAMFQALAEAHATPDQVGTWDLHATATPGDYSEIATFRSVFPGKVLATARKGTFGHGMGAGGGWELTAQYLGFERGRLYPTPLSHEHLNASIAGLHDSFLFDQFCDAPLELAGKLSMGIGGVNACVLSRPFNSGS
jgi:3-oxoacyl-[acyl-carrier-protein] synthase II